MLTRSVGRGEQVIGQERWRAAAAALLAQAESRTTSRNDRVRMARLRAAAAPPRYVTAQMMNRFGGIFRPRRPHCTAAIPKVLSTTSVKVRRSRTMKRSAVAKAKFSRASGSAFSRVR